MHFSPRREGFAHLVLYFIPDIFVLYLCLLFSTDYATHVRPPLFGHLPEDALIGPSTSIAIWNMNKVIVGLTAMVWVANASFLVQGKSLSICFADELNTL